MTFDLILATVTFAFVSTITPGPNNLMLMASGVNWGLRRTVPHLAGVSLGVVAMVLVLGAGLAQVFLRYPAVAVALKVASLGYMLWLAWRIATAAAPEDGATRGRPLSFLQAAGFQWVNPKVWAMSLTGISVYSGGYSGDGGIAGVLPVALAFLMVGPPSNVAWVVMGRALRRALADPVVLRRFNIVMAFLLVASLWPVLAG
jgi:threonine/homoserine/homoserine lactone efflux protein